MVQSQHENITTSCHISNPSNSHHRGQIRRDQRNEYPNVVMRESIVDVLSREVHRMLECQNIFSSSIISSRVQLLILLVWMLLRRVLKRILFSIF